jgi:formate dehydrogenase alpha subunit
VVGLAAAFGSGAMTNSIAEFEDSGCIFIIGSNTTACHPLIAQRIFRAKEKGAKLIIADPRNIQLGRFADLAVNHRMGSDVALLNGMMHLILKNGWQAREYIDARTESFEAVEACVEQYTPKKVQEITGVNPSDLEKLAELYATHPPAAILYTMGITQHTTGVDNVKSICNLAMMCGNVGVASGGVNPLRGQNNVQGACDMGGLPNVFPGYQIVSNPDLNAKFAKAWGKENLPDRIGLTILEMVNAILDGRLKALFVIGENPKLSDPDWQHLHHALKEIDFLVVQDLFLSETAQVADVVLAAASSAEKDGTFSNTERRCMRIFKAIEPIGDTLPDWEIICRLATAMGYPMSYNHPEEIFREIASLTPSYAGMTYDRLGIDGLQWPCPTPEHPGTVYLHKEMFTRGKGQFHAIEYKDPAEMPDETYPYFLTTGRMFAHYHTGTMTRVSPALDREQPTGYVEINPVDAGRLEIHEGEMIVITSPRGKVEAPAKITPAVEPGNLFLPIHFGENPTNVLTNAESFDPLAKIPEFKVGKARLEKLME